MDEYEVVPIDGEGAEVDDIMPTEDEQEEITISDESYDPEEPVEPSAPEELPGGEVADEPEPDSIGYPPDEDILPTEEGDDEIVLEDAEDGGEQEVEPDVIENIEEIPIIGSAREGDVIPVLMRSGAPLGISPVGWGDRVQTDIDLASQAAAEAKAVAEATGQHFWEDANGAHVTEITKEDWQAEEAKQNPFADVSDNKPYHNLLMNSLGILLRTALKNLVSITRSAIAFFDGDGNGSANVVASFGKDGAQIGYAASTHSRINSDSFGIYEGADRLISFYSDNRLAKMYAGISIPPSYAKYTKAEAAVIYNYIENDVELGQNRQTFNDKETGEATDYHLSTPLPTTFPSVATHIDVLDGDSDALSSADCGGLFYFYDPLASDDWELQYDVIFDPQDEAEGPLSIEAGGAELSFDNGVIGTSSSFDVAGDITCGEVNGVDVTAIPMMKSGVVATRSVAAGSVEAVSITFPEEFAAAPNVVCGLQSTQTQLMGNCSCVVTAMSATGFTVALVNNSSSARNIGCYWIAM